MTQNSGWNIGGEGGDSFPFEQIGASVTGTIDSLSEVQQTDLQTGEPKTFSNGQPMMMYRVGLANTNAPRTSPEDNGHRSVYLKGSRASDSRSSLAAVLDAVKAATGGTNLEPGGVLTLTYVGDGEAKGRGFSAPKLYQAQYQRPSMNLGGAPAPQQAPAPQYAPQPVPQQAYQPAPAPAQPMPQYQPPQQPAPQQVQAPAPQYAQAPAPAPAGPPPLTREQLQAMVNAGVDIGAMGYSL